MNIRSTPKRGGFTLVEMLVVIAIIGILAALITAAAAMALSSAKQTRIKVEVDSLASAMEAFKQKYGSYPPADLNCPGNGPQPRTRSFWLSSPERFPATALSGGAHARDADCCGPGKCGCLRLRTAHRVTSYTINTFQSAGLAGLLAERLRPRSDRSVQSQQPARDSHTLFHVVQPNAALVLANGGTLPRFRPLANYYVPNPSGSSTSDSGPQPKHGYPIGQLRL